MQWIVPDATLPDGSTGRISGRALANVKRIEAPPAPHGQALSGQVLICPPAEWEPPANPHSDPAAVARAVTAIQSFLARLSSDTAFLIAPYVPDETGDATIQIPFNAVWDDAHLRLPLQLAPHLAMNGFDATVASKNESFYENSLP